MHYIGTFWGYRERDADAPPLMSYTFPPVFSVENPALNPWDMSNLSYQSFLYKVYEGYADDDYPADFTMVDVALAGRTSRQMLFFVYDNPLDLITTYDGTTPQTQRLMQSGFSGIEAIRGFMARNFIPGAQSRYQLVVFM